MLLKKIIVYQTDSKVYHSNAKALENKNLLKLCCTFNTRLFDDMVH